MPDPKKLHCPTCKSDEAHTHLSGPQDAWLRQETGLTYTWDYWKCARTGCLTIRSYWSENTYVRVPPELA